VLQYPSTFAAEACCLVRDITCTSRSTIRFPHRHQEVPPIPGWTHNPVLRTSTALIVPSAPRTHTTLETPSAGTLSLYKRIQDNQEYSPPTLPSSVKETSPHGDFQQTLNAPSEESRLEPKDTSSTLLMLTGTMWASTLAQFRSRQASPSHPAPRW